MRIGIDLLWVRVSVCGGTESYIRNLLDGFVQFNDKHEFLLFVSKDNAESFQHYKSNKRMKLVVCDIESKSPFRRLLWEQFNFDKLARCHQLDLMFVPVYSKPLTCRSKIPYISVIHDLQALHYPEYFSLVKRLMLRHMWRYTCKSSRKIITISDYGKEDIIKKYPFVQEKVTTIYNPIIVEDSYVETEMMEEKYGIKSGEFLFCLSSMLPHKNLDTIFRMMKIRNTGDLPLLLGGVGGNSQEVKQWMKDYQIEDRVVLTGFVEPKERDWLYQNCKLFLFPSIFEGFGMPPIEAMKKGKRVVMTKKTCLEEVTQGKATYVENPFDEREWDEKLNLALQREEKIYTFPEYEMECIVKQYMEQFENL